jgi:hypothetical protein
VKSSNPPSSIKNNKLGILHCIEGLLKFYKGIIV